MKAHTFVEAALLITAPWLAIQGVADDGSARAGRRWWGEVEIGYGVVHFEPDDALSGTRGLFYAGFGGGYVANPHLWLGAEVSGWLYEGSNLDDPSVGEGLMLLNAVARVYPVPDGPWHFRLGAGYARHWNNRPNEIARRSGLAWTAGVGYDFAPTKRVACSCALLAVGGDVADARFMAASLTLGVRFL